MLLCCDFDWTTFFPDSQELTQQNLAALKKWRQTGNLTAVVTNRNLPSLQCGLSDYTEYFDYLAVNMGAEIYQAPDELLRARVLAEDEIGKLLSGIHQLRMPIGLTYCGVGTDKVSSQPLKDLTKLRLWFRNEEEAITALTQLPRIGRHTLPTHYRPACARNDDPIDEEMAQKYRFFVDFAAAEVGKETGVTELAQLLDMPVREVVTVGDSLLDWGMLQKFEGYAIADSKVAREKPELATVRSVAELVEVLL